MKAKQFFAQGGPTRFALRLSRYLPPVAGRWLAALAARLIVILKPDMYQAARSNLCHVLGVDVSSKHLNRTLYRLFFNAARGYYEYFHNASLGRSEVKDFHPPVKLRPETQRHIEEALASGRGLFILACHLSNVDMGGAALAQALPVPLQVLSLSDPPPGFEIFNALREKYGALITPLDAHALRDAMVRLRNGGVVVTGPDRPIAEGNQPVEFFGATAYLPTGYIRMPLRTNCLVMTLAVIEEAGVYWITTHPPMEMERTGDRDRDIQVNLRRILSEVEDFIRRHPEQWMMFLPVWGEA
ncbi:MAG: hypothetical protein JXA33_14400 [Anaerolineae bacterium]|nr:hypothetical protein [Anaerolineae bacterium]